MMQLYPAGYDPFHGTQKFETTIQAVLKAARLAYQEGRLQAQNNDESLLESCTYAGPYGPCVIGASIPEEIAQDWDALPCQPGPSVGALIARGLFAVTDEYSALLSQDELGRALISLQVAHDNWATSQGKYREALQSDFVQKLEATCQKFGVE